MTDSPRLNNDPSLLQPNAVLDPFGGVAGDMLLGALVDLGASLETIRAGLSGLDIEPWSMEATRETRRHLSGLCVKVECSESTQHRHLADVLRILRQARLPEPVLQRAEHTFKLLAQAEGRAHGIDPSEVHFHEVGAADAILDICGVHFAMHLLGLSSFWVSALPSGSGFVDCAHGRLPCPVPAVLHLLQDFDLVLGEGEGEMVTPTGAALVASLGKPLRGRAGVHRLAQAGYGAGTRKNSLCRVWRLCSAEPAHSVPRLMQELGLAQQEVIALACDLDDCTPQALAFLCEQLMAAGALDARLVPTAMKKGRSAQTLELLVQDEKAVLEKVMRRLIQDSSTLGVRYARQLRFVAPREIRTVQTPWGAVRVKQADFGWHTRAYPEYEDCAEIARAQGVALVEVQRAALKGWEDTK